MISSAVAPRLKASNDKVEGDARSAGTVHAVYVLRQWNRVVSIVTETSGGVSVKQNGALASL
jgi:hypothetical protein